MRRDCVYSSPLERIRAPLGGWELEVDDALGSETRQISNQNEAWIIEAAMLHCKKTMVSSAGYFVSNQADGRAHPNPQPDRLPAAHPSISSATDLLCGSQRTGSLAPA
jgi:hypothetical protein